MQAIRKYSGYCPGEKAPTPEPTEDKAYAPGTAFQMGRDAIGEALALQWPDLDLNSRTIRVERAFSDGALNTPKSARRLRVHLAATSSCIGMA